MRRFFRHCDNHPGRVDISEGVAGAVGVGRELRVFLGQRVRRVERRNQRIVEPGGVVVAEQACGLQLSVADVKPVGLPLKSEQVVRHSRGVVGHELPRAPGFVHHGNRRAEAVLDIEIVLAFVQIIESGLRM